MSKKEKATEAAAAAPKWKYELKKAVRKAKAVLIGLWSKSGGGKTYSALLLMRGILDALLGVNKGKIAVLDTENERSTFYADDPAIGEWFHIDIQPPFTAEKYIEAFKDAVAQGADGIIIDSTSHIWEGEGGALDQAEEIEEAAKKKNGFSPGLSKWKNPKMRHKRFSNFVTRSSIPVIFCLRAKDGIKQIEVDDPERPGKKKKEIVSVGPVPIAEKNFVYEMTLDLHMTKDGAFDLKLSKTIPNYFRQFIKEGGKVTRDMGLKIGEWMKGGEAIDKEKVDLKRDGQNAALHGVKAYTEWKDALKPAQKEKIREFHTQWVEDAREAERIKNEEEAARKKEEGQPQPGKAKDKADSDIEFM